MINKIIKQKLNSLKDEKYKTFTAKLIPNINSDLVIGVRIPQIRNLAKSLKNEEGIGLFLSTLPHEYLEENLLHASLIANEDDYNKCIFQLNEFLPYIDNWSVCDTIRPKCFRKNTDKLLEQIKVWLKSKHSYTIRFAIEMLMTYYLDAYFKSEYLQMVASVKNDDYYVKMMIAWYFATALAKQYDSAVVYIKDKTLENWTHNKTIQKAIESFRITKEQKDYLKTLKR